MTFYREIRPIHELEANDNGPCSEDYNPPLGIALIQAAFSGRNCCLFAVAVVVYFVGRTAL